MPQHMIPVLLHPIDEENANLLQREAKKIIILAERKEKNRTKSLIFIIILKVVQL